MASSRMVRVFEAELNRALELDPNYLPAYSLSPRYTSIQNRKIARLPSTRRSVRCVRKTRRLTSLIGMLEDQRKNFDAAAENYRKALEKDPNAVIAANNLAWLYAVTGKGNLDEALEVGPGRGPEKSKRGGICRHARMGSLQEESSHRGRRAIAKGRVH